MKNKLNQLFATGFGFGLSRFMPGTVGTLWGIPLAWVVMQIPSVNLQISVCLILTMIAVPICEAAEKQLGKGKDPGCIVADEYLTLPIVYLGLPFTPWVVLSGFVLHRIFDITKPPPIRQIQSMKGGVGIVIDDFLAALMALAINHLLFRFIFPMFG
ncbi:MAG: phosphatidylglycerophosphatase A [Kiritimatiellales bacterium]|nr:phosphatidylglycerophosphatase A [Kiritimatiellales bacterium]